MEGRDSASIASSMQHNEGQQDGISCGLFVILAAMAMVIGGQQAEAAGASVVKAHAAQLRAACRYAWLCFIILLFFFLYFTPSLLCAC